MATITPSDVPELVALIADAAARGEKYELRGGGSHAATGARDRQTRLLSLASLRGIVDYDPAELVLTARAATPLAEIEALLARQQQMLAFEPLAPPGATIGGVIAAGVSGPRRVAAGGVRDHLLGFAAVSGRGEAFIAGGKVVKNVTGFDLSKLMCNSWGRLAALTEVTLKVLPAPRATRWFVINGLSPAQSYAAMARALGSQAGPSAALYRPGLRQSLLRIEGFTASVEARAMQLKALLAEFGALEAVAPPCFDDLTPPAPGALWRIVLPARGFAALGGALDALGMIWSGDWGGGLIRARGGASAAAIRAAVAAVDGHAMLVEDPDALHPRVPVFMPQPRALAALEARVRVGFDPAGVFKTGRFESAD